MLNNFYFFIDFQTLLIFTSGAFDLSWKVKGRRRKKKQHQSICLAPFICENAWNLLAPDDGGARLNQSVLIINCN